MAHGEKLDVFHPERLRWFRNINAVGAIALAGAGVVLPAYREVLFFGAGLSTAQAGGAEIMRQRKVEQKISATT